jgi:hypothetical protein
MATPRVMKKRRIGADVLTQRSFYSLAPHEPAKETDRGEYRNHTLLLTAAESLLL